MKKLLVALLVFALVVPTAVASGPPPPGPPPPRGGIPPIGLQIPGDISALDLADRPMVEELAGLEELSLEKRAKAHELVRSLSDEQRARIGQLLAANPLPVLGKVGDPVPPIQSADELRRHAEALKALLPEMNRWKDTMSAGLAGILTPEQYALYQDSLLPPPPAQMADVGPQTETDCYYKHLYDYYGVQYAYYAYIYAYYSYYYYENLLSYNLFLLAYDTYLYGYYGYIYAYYAYIYYYDATYAWYAYYYNFHTYIIAYHTYLFGYDVYSISGGTYAYYAYVYAYYAYIYYYYGTYYGHYCYSTPGGPQPGRWEAQGNFYGSFRVESDRATITNFEGLFKTPICGKIKVGVQGDLTPPSEIEISDNTFHLYMRDGDTLTFLRIDGTFNTEMSVEGDYSWGVDGCGFGGPIDWSASWQGD